MADIKNEVQSVRDYVGPVLAGVTRYHLQNIPSTYVAGEMSIRFAGSASETETAYHYRRDLRFQIVYFGANELDCLAKMQALETNFNNDQLIPIKGSARYLRLEPFSMSEPFKTSTTGVYAIIGTLEAKLREARPQPVSEPINNVGITTFTEDNASTFGVIDGTATPNPNDGFTWDDIENGNTIFDKE